MANQLPWILITALLLSTANLSTCASVDLTKIHEQMTEKELLATFNVNDRAAVPDYEVVPIVHRPNQARRNRRSTSPHEKTGHHVVTVKELTLYLEPMDHVLIGEDTPVYLASGNESHPHGIRYEQIEKAWPTNFSMYQDPANNAAVAMFKEPDGQVNFEGTIGNDLVIKPLPSKFKSSKYHGYHLLYKNLLIDQKKLERRPLSPEDYFAKSYWSKKRRPVQVDNKVDIVYPEMLVIVDHDTYLAHGKNLQALCRYMALFWNAVDLRFRAIKEPEVRLNIAGLIVPIDEEGAPYLTKYHEEKRYLRSVQTVHEIGKYLYGEERFDNNTYDFTIAITNRDLCTVTRNRCDPSTLSISRARGACLHDENSSDAAIGLITDLAGFDGVLTAAHEVGHLLGAVHDRESKYYRPDKKCNWIDGFLMASTLEGSSNALLLSDCSIIQIRFFIGREAECLRNKPVVKKPIAKMLPGQLMSRDDQCRTMHGMSECKGSSEDECRKLYCRKPGDKLNDVCVSIEPPAEGTPCSDGGMCLDGLCIHKIEENNDVDDRSTTVE